MTDLVRFWISDRHYSFRASNYPLRIKVFSWRGSRLAQWTDHIRQYIYRIRVEYTTAGSGITIRARQQYTTDIGSFHCCVAFRPIIVVQCLLCILISPAARKQTSGPKRHGIDTLTVFSGPGMQGASPEEPNEPARLPARDPGACRNPHLYYRWVQSPLPRSWQVHWQLLRKQGIPVYKYLANSTLCSADHQAVAHHSYKSQCARDQNYRYL